jgi:hypothetical protein
MRQALNRPGSDARGFRDFLERGYHEGFLAERGGGPAGFLAWNTEGDSKLESSSAVHPIGVRTSYRPTNDE